MSRSPGSRWLPARLSVSVLDRKTEESPSPWTGKYHSIRARAGVTRQRFDGEFWLRWKCWLRTGSGSIGSSIAASRGCASYTEKRCFLKEIKVACGKSHMHSVE
jgi:hypothetical protein